MKLRVPVNCLQSGNALACSCDPLHHMGNMVYVSRGIFEPYCSFLILLVREVENCGVWSSGYWIHINVQFD